MCGDVGVGAWGGGDGGRCWVADAGSAREDVTSSWNFSRLPFVCGAAGTAILVSFRVDGGGEVESLAGSLAGSVLDRSAMEEEERSSKRSFRTVVLPALLRSLSGGVCRRGVGWGWVGLGGGRGGAGICRRFALGT